jgi:uncharacterized protein YoxC
MISNSFGLGEIIIIVFDVILLSIPVLVVWLLFKTLRKISRHSEQIEQEVKKLREEIQSLREKLPDVSSK